jgi:crotonobetainyl-CoA:carnitine CoA-transferase CaiB-like acyl-CoA transferase
VGNDGQFAKFCEVAGRPDLPRDPRFTRNADRVRHRDVLVPLLAGLMKARTRQDWLSSLEAAKVPCGPIQSLAEAFADPQAQERGMTVPVAHPLADGLRLVASPIKLSGTPVQYRRPPPLLGEHTEEVLRELGVTPEELAALKARAVL